MTMFNKSKKLLKTTGLLSLVILFLSLIFYSCKKTDFITDTPNHEIDFAKKFFETKVTPTAEIAAVIEKLKQQNERTGFISKLPANCGLPIWDKVSFHKSNSGSTNNSDIIIPLTDNGESLSAVLIANPKNAEYKIRCITARYLYNLCHSSNKNISNAENFLGLFMVESYKAFGKSNFYNIPADLFKNNYIKLNKDYTKSLSISPSNTSGQIAHSQSASEKGSDITPNTAVFECYYIPTPLSCTCQGGASNCYDWQDGCSDCSALYCVNVGDDDEGDTGGGDDGGGDPIGGGTGGGAGGTGGGGNGDPCPSAVSTWYLYNAIPGCDDPPPPPPPCDTYVQNLEQNVNFINIFKYLNTTGPGAVLSLPYEVGYEIRDVNQYNSNTYLQKIGSTNTPTIDWVLPPNTLQEGFLHSHYAGLNSMFTPEDVILMAQTFITNHAKDTNNLFCGITSTYSVPFIMKVGNTAKFRQFCEKIVGSNGMDKNKMQIFKNNFYNKINSYDPDANEKGFLQVIKEFGGEEGLLLFQGDNNCNKWVQRKVDNFGTVSTVNCIGSE